MGICSEIERREREHQERTQRTWEIEREQLAIVTRWNAMTHEERNRRRIKAGLPPVEPVTP